VTANKVQQQFFDMAARFLFEAQDKGVFKRIDLPCWIDDERLAALEQCGLVKVAGAEVRITAGLGPYYRGLENQARPYTCVEYPSTFYDELTSKDFRLGLDWWN